MAALGEEIYPQPHTHEELLLDEFRSELFTRLTDPKAGDYVQAAWAKALYTLLDSYDPYRTIVLEQAMTRPDLPIEVRVELHWKAALELGMIDKTGYPDNKFPQYHCSPEAWYSYLIQLSDPKVDPLAYARMRRHVLEDFNPATKPERVAGAIITLAGLSKQGEVGNEVTIFDEACSLNICLPGYKVWAAQGQLPYHQVEVVYPRSKQTDVNRTKQLRRHMFNAPTLKYGLGADIVDRRTEENRSFAIASSFYGSQLLDDPVSVEAYFLLEDSEHDNIEFSQKDIRNFDVESFLEARNDELFDMAWLLTAAYQMTQPEIKATLDRAFQVAKFILFQDTLTRHSRAQSGLRRNTRGYEQTYKYRTMLAERIKGVTKFYEIFVWELANCKRGYFGRDIGRIGLST